MMPTRFAHDTGEITITPLDPDAWQDYKLLRLQALATDPQAFEASYADQRTQPDAYWKSQLTDAATNRGSLLLFATQGQRPVGVIGALVTEEPHLAHIRAAFVAPAARGRGVGTALLEAVLHDLRREPAIQTVRLSVNAAQVAAVTLYGRCGFGIVADDRATFGDGQAYDGYLMEKVLR